MRARSSVLDTNLIVNGGAEAGLTNLVGSIPGWTRNGSINVLPYNLTGLLSPVEPAPAAHDFQYFSGPSGGSATITQDIDVSAAASNISGGNVKFNESAYLGRTTGVVGPATFAVAFKNAAGQTFRTVTLGPASGPVGLYLEQQIGLVPSGTGSPRP